MQLIFRLLTTTVLVLSLSACALSYHPDVNQGNYVTSEALGQVEVGMTRQQVSFILGTPVAASPFHGNRWDYVYFLESSYQQNRRAHAVIWFENETVARIETRIAPSN